jgi:outer membrane protein assembly factor BamB
MSDHWPVFGYDPGHSGHGSGVTRPEWPIDELWRHDLEGKVAWQAPVVDEGGNVFVHGKMTQVLAANFRAIGPEGQLRWALHTSPGIGPGAPAPTLAGDRVVLPDRPDAWVVESLTGGRIYQTSLHPSAGVNHPQATVASQTICTGFYAFDLESGEPRWDFEPDRGSYRIVTPDGTEIDRPYERDSWTAAISDGTVYVAGGYRQGETRYVPEDELSAVEDTTSRSSIVLANDTSGEYRDEFEEYGHLYRRDEGSGEDFPKLGSV